MELSIQDRVPSSAGARHYSPAGGTALRAFAISFAALLCLAPVAAPALAAKGSVGPAAALYLSFAPVCHQRPDRSFAFEGRAWAVCHRCAGIYCGLLAGLALPAAALGAVLRRRRAWVLGTGAVVCADFLTNYSGLAMNTACSRFVSGFAFGAVAGALVLAGLAELIEARRARLRSHPTYGDAR